MLIYNVNFVVIYNVNFKTGRISLFLIKGKFPKQTELEQTKVQIITKLLGSYKGEYIIA